MLERGWEWFVRRATTIACPNCDNVGRGYSNSHNFASRGIFERYTVYKCLQCKSGLFVSPLSGAFVGRPKTIPERTWFDLEAQWSRNITPPDMQEENLAEIGLMLLSMCGFVHGYRRLLWEVETKPNPSPEQLFYLNSLRGMCMNFFVGTSKRSSDVTVRDVLSKHNLSSLLKPIDEILSTPLGSIMFVKIMTRYRNKFLTHELFQLRPLEGIYEEFDMREIDNWILYHGLERELFDKTSGLFYELRERYPAAWLRPVDFKM